MHFTADMLLMFYFVYSVFIGMTQGVLVVAAPTLAMLLSFVVIKGTIGGSPERFTDFFFNNVTKLVGIDAHLSISDNPIITSLEASTGKNISGYVSFLFVFSLLTIFFRLVMFAVGRRINDAGAIAVPSRLIGAALNLVLSFCIVWMGMALLDVVNSITPLGAYNRIVSSGFAGVVHSHNPFSSFLFS